MMIRAMVFASLGLLAACAGEAPDEQSGVDQAEFLKSAVLTGCLADKQPEALCTCFAGAIVTDIDPDVLELFYDIASTSGIEELNHGDWEDTLDEGLKTKVETHTQNLRAACAN